MFWLALPPHSEPEQDGGDEAESDGLPPEPELGDDDPEAGVVEAGVLLPPVVLAAVLVTGTPSVASQPHGSVMVTVVGVLSQTVHSYVVTVKPLGMWLGPGVQVGVASVQLSVTV